MRRTVQALLLLSALAFAPGAVRADDATSAPPPDKSRYTLLNPTPADQLRSLCADRPTKSNAPCTVDAGHWQLESDVYNYSWQRVSGVTTFAEFFTNPTLKLGITNTLDFEVNIAPYERVTTRDRASGVVAGGIGDLFLKAKLNLQGDDGGSVSVALFPYLKVPTAPRSIGNGAVEGGLLAPIQVNLTDKLALSVVPEADVLADRAGGPGRHLNMANVLTLNYQTSKTVTLGAEIWGDADFDPAGTATQASFDVAAAWIPTKAPDIQLDGGVNFGLNKATPGVQVYAGITKRW
jgi:hypothetical protein